jgi:DNA-binding MarR family transcriptional regulator
MSALSAIELADRVGEIMPAISREFLKHSSGEFYKMKVTMPQCIILDVLDKTGGMKMKDLAGYMSVTTAAMTGIVDRLVREGYASRKNDPDDRRVINVKLTPKGAHTAKNANEHKRKAMIKLLGVLSQGEREDYLRILTRIKDGIKGL